LKILIEKLLNFEYKLLAMKHTLKALSIALHLVKYGHEQFSKAFHAHEETLSGL
jgi:hypothetical protein